LVDEWNAWRGSRKKELGESTQSKTRQEDSKEEIEVWIEEVIEQIEEIVVVE
jgi:translation initiation factor 3 subunit B